jgi:hypothetical protein
MSAKVQENCQSFLMVPHAAWCVAFLELGCLFAEWVAFPDRHSRVHFP